MLGGVAVLRRLAAIDAADVPSYLRPVEAADEGALARLRRPRHDLIDPKIAFHKGRTLETGGVEPTPIAAG
jgi:adenylate cyclase